MFLLLQFSNWLEQNRELLGAAYNTGINGIAANRNNQAWTARRVGEFATYFETGYVEDEINLGDGNDVDDGDDGGDGGGGGDVGDGDDNVPDGASVAALSIFTVIAIMTANLIA